MPNYTFECKNCENVFEEICSFADFDAGFPEVKCVCGGNVEKLLCGAPGAVFANPRESSKWNNWDYRRGTTAEEAKDLRRRAEAAHKGPMPYKRIDDIGDGRRMNFID